MAQAGSGGGVPEGIQPVAAAHHGSVSREQRAIVEEALKSGRLPAVVATSSLELGIDMGAVDLVVQVEAPPTVASGLQRVGRAGHQVGAVSRGVLFPKYRGDLVQCALVAERMKAGAIESIRYLRNPLDVLAQQIVAIVSERPRTVDEVAAVVRRSAAFASLPDSALHAVLDMLAGRYPSDAFAELRPRLTWDRVTDTLTARAGAQRLAVTSGGTIPDRGLFGVFLVGAEGTGGRRVGELDEEMVYESRVGDVFLLGSSSWRIEDITHDRVLVTPAPGQPGKMPFWKGDAPGRPLELGRALGAFLREVGSATPEAGLERARAAGLDEWGAANLQAYLAEQKAATGHLPDDRTLLVERFRDELGDWRLVVHSPFGAQVNAPWALVLAARLRERYGVDVASMHSDDGIVLRLPDTTGEPPEADLAVLDPDDVEREVTAEVGSSALFASRFRECAARALLLPRRDPRKRTPLWQQRQRAAQLLSVASEFASFPITLEAAREVLQDVYDVPGPGRADARRALPQGPRRRRADRHRLAVRPVAAVRLRRPVPLRGRRAAGRAPRPGAGARHRPAGRAARPLGAARAARRRGDGRDRGRAAAAARRSGIRATSTAPSDLLRVIGDLTAAEAAARGVPQEWLTELVDARRALVVRIAGEERYVAIEDAGRLRDALGTALPVGVPGGLHRAGRRSAGRPGRPLRPHPRPVPARRGRHPAGPRRRRRHRDAAAAHRRPAGWSPASSGPAAAGQEWCDAEVLRSIRRRSLAKLRQEVEPVPIGTLARFTPSWQSVGGRLRGADGVLAVVEQLAGALVPASALESLVLPARVRDYSPAMLDELTSAGEVLWAGRRRAAGRRRLDQPRPGRPRAAAAARAAGGARRGRRRSSTSSAGGQALFFRGLSDLVGATDDTAMADLVWDLVWAGVLTNDTLAPLRTRLGGGGTHRSKPAAPRARIERGGTAAPGWAARRCRPAPARPTVAGRWSRLPDREPNATRRTTARAEALLERHGVLTRGAVMAEQVRRRLLRGLPGAARVRGEQPGAARLLRRDARGRPVRHARIGRPAAHLRVTRPDARRRRRPGGDRPGERLRRGAAVARTAGRGRPGRRRPGRGHRLAQGRPGTGRAARPAPWWCWSTASSCSTSSAAARPCCRGPRTSTCSRRRRRRSSGAVSAGALGRMVVQKADGASVHESTPLSAALQAAGFAATPRGLRLRA